MKRPTQAGPPDAAPSGPPPPPSRVVPLALLALTLALFAVLKVYALNITIGDEHLYFHMAVLINKGLLPYRDFYFTHPPLHLYPAALLFRVWGYHLYLGQLLPNLSMLAGGLCVFAIGRRALSPLEGVIACALFLLSFDALRISTHFTGGNLSFALAMAGLWLGYRDRPLPAGIMFGLAALVAVYALPGAAAVALLLWGRSRGRMLRFAGTTAAVVAGGNLAFYALAGWDYVFQVYLSQFEKGPEGSLVGYRLYHRLGFILFENRLLTAGSLAGLALLLWDVRSRLRAKRSHWTVAELAARWPSGIERAETLLMLVAWFASFWTFYLLLKKHHSYYFIFIMPVFAWCSALAYVEMGRGIVAFLRLDRAPPPRAERRRARRRAFTRGGADRVARMGPAVAAMVLTVASVVVVEATYHPYWVNRRGGASRHTWQPSPYLGRFDRWVRAAFWSPSYDPKYPPMGLTRYLQHESLQMTTAEQLYEAVRQYSQPGDPIFGDYGLAALVASETNRRVAADLVDTSWYQITSGLVQIEDWIAAIEKDGVTLLVVQPTALLMREPVFSQYARQNFRAVTRVRDPQLGEFHVMSRNSE